MGDRSFAVSGPRIWNMLPVLLCLADDIPRFKRLLKADLLEAAALADVTIHDSGYLLLLYNGFRP